jgi:hypothetical protein
VLAGRQADVVLVAVDEHAVDGDVVDAFGRDGHVFGLGQVDVAREIDLRLVAVQAPERRPGDVALRALHLHPVAQPDFEIARVPDPRGDALCSGGAAYERQQEAHQE